MSSGDAFFNNLSMRQGFFGGAQEPMQRMDFNFGDAGLGGPFGHPLAPMIMQPLINSMFGHGGMMPAQFSPQQSFYDQQRAKSYMQARQAAMSTASQADRETYVGMLRGMAQAQGTPWGLEQQRSANVMAGDLAYMAPMLAQAMPETFDALHGTRGSATVMASFLHRGGLTAVDSATGRTGVSGASAGVLAAEMHRRFFGADADLAGWRGLSAGRAGALYDELQTRGLMGMSIGARTGDEQLASLTSSVTSRQDAVQLLRAQDPAKYATLGTGPGGAGGADVTDAIKNLKDTNSTQYDALLRQFDANQIGNRLKSMSGAVAAMREIFGDMGHPNAPMSQLIEGLNKLTQGGLATMSPGQLEQTVRTTQVIARTSGMGMQAFQALASQGAAEAQQMGLDPRFGLTSAQSAAEFGAAFGQVGRGDVAAWGRVDREKLTVMDAQLRRQAAASPMANRLGAIMRIYETMGPEALAGTPLAAVAEAIKRGDNEFEYKGKTESLNFDEARYRQITGASHVTGAAANDYLRSNAATQEQIDRYGIADITRRAQPAEARQMMVQHFRESVVGQLSASGVTGDRARNITTVASAAQAQALSTMPVDVRSNDAARNQYLVDATRAALKSQLGMSDAEIETAFPKAQFATMVAGGVGRIQERIRTDIRYQDYQSLHGYLDSQSEAVEARRRVIGQENQAEVAVGKALAGLSTAGPLARIMDLIMNPKEDIGTNIKAALGGVDPARVRELLKNIDPNDLKGPGAKERLGLVMEDLVNTAREYEANKTSKAGTAEERAAKGKALTARIVALRAGGSATLPALRDSLVTAGLIQPEANDETVQEMARKVMNGEEGTDDDRKKIGGLVAAGALTDAAAIRRHQEEALAGDPAKITSEEDIEKALRGEMNDKLSPETRDKLKQYAALKGGVDALADAASIAVGGKVGAKELTGVSTQQELLDAALSESLPGEGPERDRAVAERRRLARNVLDRGRVFTDALLGDRAAMKNMGAGSFDLVSGAHKKQQEMARIANTHSLDLVSIMSGDIDESTLSEKQRIAVKQIRGLQSEVDKARNQMIRKLDRTDEFKEMTPGELKQLEDYRTESMLSDADKNKNLVKEVLGAATGDDDEGRAKIEKALGEGPEGEVRRYALKERYNAKAELQKMADRAGLSIAQLQKQLAGAGGFDRIMGIGSLSGEEVSRAQELISTVGAMTEGDTSQAVLDSITQEDERREAAKKETSDKAKATGGKTVMSGEVTLKGLDKLDFAKAYGTGMGSTPV